MSEEKRGRATLRIDRERCEGHGQCALAAPGLLHIDDKTGEVVIDVPDVSTHLEAARRAVNVCPAIALRIE
jgi:ferredoxin